MLQSMGSQRLGHDGATELNYVNLNTHMKVKVLVTQSCLTLCDLMDCSPPGSSVHGILQARILEWVAVSSSRGSSRPGDRICVSYVSCVGRWVFYHKRHLGSESEVAQLCPTLATPWTPAYQAPPSMGFSRQKYRSGVPLPSPSLYSRLWLLLSKWVFLIASTECLRFLPRTCLGYTLLLFSC